MHLVVGLGNPGTEYEDHRHNVGFMVADELAGRWKMAAFKTRFGALMTLGELAKVPAVAAQAVRDGAAGSESSHRVALVKPMEFMNLSGNAVQRAASFYQVEPKNIIVLHDDIDLEYGRLKVKAGGGHGGHNGLRSITDHLGPAFLRVRIGVGHPGSKDRVIGHVLGPFSKSERAELPFVIGQAADAVDAIVNEGVTPAMNRFNQEDKKKR